MSTSFWESPPRVITKDELVPDEHGNTYITFGDGTGAVHTKDGWIMVAEDSDERERLDNLEGK